MESRSLKRRRDEAAVTAVNEAFRTHERLGEGKSVVRK